ncbi:MAG: acyltransferase [Patescibacteria group bacterium]
MNEVLRKIKRSGLIEFIYLSINTIYKRVESVIKILILNLRSYRVSYSVLLGKYSYFFQSTNNSIKIGKNSRIGFGVRLEAGFKGKILIGNDVLIHDYSFIYAHSNLYIGDNSMISPNVFITDFNHKFPHIKYKHLLKSPKGYDDRKVTIGSNVWIGANSIILPGVSIGNNAVVGAGSVVTKSIPENALAIGNPARIIKK